MQTQMTTSEWLAQTGRRVARLMLGMAVLALGLGAGWTGLAVGESRLAADASLSVTPGSVAIQAGQTVTLTVYLANVQDLYGADVRLSFNAALLQVQDADASRPGIQLAPGTVPYPDFPVMNTADNTAGTAWYAATQTNPREPFSGSGTVAIITLLGIAAGTSPISVTYSKIVTRDGDPIAHTASGGQIVVTIDGVTLTPTPTPQATDTLQPTPTPTGTATVTRTPTVSPSPTRTGTGTVVASATATAGPSQTPTQTETPGSTAIGTQAPKNSVTPTSSQTLTPSATATAGASATSGASATPTPTVSATPTVPLGGVMVVDGEVDQDTYLSAWEPTRCFGGDGDIRVRNAAEGAVKRILLRFDLSDIPTGARVTFASVRLCSNDSQVARLHIGAFGLKRSWEERQANWHQAANDQLWAADGASAMGDIAAVPVSTTDIGPDERCFEWEITALVQRWLSEGPMAEEDDPALEGIDANYGLVLMPVGDNPANEYGFYSTEYRNIPMVQPQFLVQYDLPTPTPTVTSSVTPTATPAPTLAAHTAEEIWLPLTMR